MMFPVARCCVTVLIDRGFVAPTTTRQRDYLEVIVPILRTSTAAGKWFPFPRDAANSQLSFEAIGVLAYLLEKGDGWQVRVEDLCDASPARHKKVRRVLKELEQARYLVRQRVRVEGGKFDWVSTVYDAPYTGEVPIRRQRKAVSIRQVPAETAPSDPDGEMAPYDQKGDMVTTVSSGFQSVNNNSPYRPNGDIYLTLTDSESDTEETIVSSVCVPDGPQSPGVSEIVVFAAEPEPKPQPAWPSRLSKRQIASLEAAGFSPASAQDAGPMELLKVPGIAAAAVKWITGKDVQSVVDPEISARHKSIMDAYCEALAYSPQQMKTIFNGGREGAACKRLAVAGFYAPQVAACYRYYKSQSFWKDKHLSLDYIAQNISAWLQNGAPTFATQGNQNGHYQQRGFGRPAQKYSDGLDALSQAERDDLTTKLRAARIG
jgi:hypothetical protein